MSDQEKCAKCGSFLKSRVVTDPASEKKIVKDCPKCNPTVFGLPALVANNRLTEMPV